MSPAIIMTLRAFHILSGVFWVGSITLLARFIVPASRETEKPPGAFLGELFKNRKLGAALAGAALVTVITGMILYAGLYGSQAWNFGSPGPAEGFGVGGLLGIAALVIGAGYGVRMFVDLSRQAPGSETAEVVSQRAGRVAILTRILMVLLLLATILMAIARYL
jgi:uncharacterized membrane protein